MSNRRKRITVVAPSVGPLLLPDCALWLRADLGVAAGTVATWPDQSGNARDFTQSGGSEPTAVATGGPNGQWRMRFAANKELRRAGSSFGALSAAEFFIVHKFDAEQSAAGTTNVPWYFCSIASNDLWVSDSDNNVYAGTGRTTRAAVGNPTQSMVSWHIGNIISTATEYTVNVGDQVLYTTGTNTVGFPATCVVGAGNVASGGFMVGDIAEILIYSRKLTTDERAFLKRYFAQRYGAIPGTA